MKNKTNPGLKIICLNRKASFNYFFEDIYEAGLILKGSEIKSVRNGKVNISEAYAIERDGELYLINSHISSYKQASLLNHNPIDERKLFVFVGLFDEFILEPYLENIILSFPFSALKELPMPALKVVSANLLLAGTKLSLK